MSKTNIKCPRCHSNKLYKFGLYKQANQKYQCRKCNHQFALGDGDGLPKMTILNVQSVAKEHTYITLINIIIVISAIIENVIIL